MQYFIQFYRFNSIGKKRFKFPERLKDHSIISQKLFEAQSANQVTQTEKKFLLHCDVAAIHFFLLLNHSRSSSLQAKLLVS